MHGAKIFDIKPVPLAAPSLVVEIQRPANVAPLAWCFFRGGFVMGFHGFSFVFAPTADSPRTEFDGAVYCDGRALVAGGSLTVILIGLVEPSGNSTR
jgi:hypothetical protein